MMKMHANFWDFTFHKVHAYFKICDMQYSDGKAFSVNVFSPSDNICSIQLYQF